MCFDVCFKQYLELCLNANELDIWQPRRISYRCLLRPCICLIRAVVLESSGCNIPLILGE